MTKTRWSQWLAWAALVAMVAGLCLLAFMMADWHPRGGGPTTQVEGGAGWPRTLVERFPDGSEGRRMELPAPPQRIVSVTLGTDEILMDLVGPDRIVAMSYLAPKPGSMVADRANEIGRFVGTDVESIVALKPDLCFLASYNRAETRSLLAECGVPVYMFQTFRNLDDVRRSIRTVGRAVGEESKAEELLAEMDRKIDYVAQRLPPADEWPSALLFDESRWVAGSNTTQTAIFQAAGLRNAAAEAGMKGYTLATEEQVLAMAPDYLIITTRWGDGEPRTDWLVNNPALAPLEAVREERFVWLGKATLSTVSHYIADAIVELAKEAHPSRFADEDL